MPINVHHMDSMTVEFGPRVDCLKSGALGLSGLDKLWNLGHICYHVSVRKGEWTFENLVYIFA